MKKPTRRQLVLDALRAAGHRGCTTAQLRQPDVGAVGFSDRIEELRDEGHRIMSVYLRPGSFLYVLEAEPAALEPAQGDDADGFVSEWFCTGLRMADPDGPACPECGSYVARIVIKPGAVLTEAA
jgi:hypothetical protein